MLTGMAYMPPLIGCAGFMSCHLVICKIRQEADLLLVMDLDAALRDSWVWLRADAVGQKAIPV
jgi:hypothetical protein